LQVVDDLDSAFERAVVGGGDVVHVEEHGDAMA